MRIIPFDAGAPASMLASWHALAVATDDELEPYIPPAPFAEALAGTRDDETRSRQCWLAAEGDAVAGYAVLELPLLDNPHLAMLDIRVDVAHRRAGLGSALAEAAASAAREAGRRTLLIEAVDGSAGAAFCTALKGEVALRSTPSVLTMAELDEALVDRWISRRAERAAGYSLARWIGGCPANLIESFASLREAMNTAPLGTLDLTIEWTPRTVRAAEGAQARVGHRHFVVCARHDASGELVALTDLVVPSRRPTVALQEDTVVRPDHRNRGLGRWVKAEMLRWLAGEEPHVERIVTWNATENDAMRSINTELGFVARDPWAEWQFGIDALTRSLVKIRGGAAARDRAASPWRP